MNWRLLLSASVVRRLSYTLSKWNFEMVKKRSWWKFLRKMSDPDILRENSIEFLLRYCFSMKSNFTRNKIFLVYLSLSISDETFDHPL